MGKRSKRYNKWYKIPELGIKFYLKDDPIYPDEARRALLFMILKAKQDLINFYGTSNSQKQIDFQTAFHFLFDDTYYIQWGDIELSFTDICNIVGYEVKWCRQKLLKKIQTELKKRGKV